MKTGLVKLKRQTTGESVFMDVTFVPLAGRDGGYDGLVSVINYSTAAKNLEEQIKTYTENLEVLVRARTRELSSANAALGRSVERISSVAESGMLLSSLKDSRAVFDTFLGRVREILGADFASLAIVDQSAGTAKAAYHTSGEAPPPGAIPSGVVEDMTARSVLRARAAHGVRPDDPRVLTVDIELPDARGIMLAWKREGEFDPMDTVLARLLATQLSFALRVTTYVGDQRRERDRSDCLRRIAVRVAGASSVGDALRIVAEELATVVPAERFLWLVRSSGDQVWLSEIYKRHGPVESVAKHASLGALGEIEAAFKLGKGHPRPLCQFSGGPAAKDLEERGKATAQQACPFGCEAENSTIKQAVRAFLESAGLIPPDDGSCVVAPVILAEGSWGLMCAHVVDGAAASCRDACFMCLAASTVGYVWQAADAASALRTLEVAGETVGDLAHDLKYPLMRITDSLAKLGAGDRAKAADAPPVELIRSEVAKLTALTRELTEVSNPGSRKPGIVDLKEVVDSCIALVSSDLAARSITLANRVGHAPPVFGDRRDIVKITLGIVANSVDAIGKSGTITVASRLVEAQPGGRQVGLVFEDSGPGVAAGNIDKVFSAFYTTKQGGSGLGLFSAKKRARANGGDIICEMGENGKSRFVVTLPVAAA
jgi:nitrogen-specific signal transduction histidine kinase